MARKRRADSLPAQAPPQPDVPADPPSDGLTDEERARLEARKNEAAALAELQGGPAGPRPLGLLGHQTAYPHARRDPR